MPTPSLVLYNSLAPGASYVVLFPMAIDGDYDRSVGGALEAFGR